METQSPTAEITEPPATHGYHSPWLAVIGVSGYKRANDAIELLNHVPTLTRRLVLYSPKQELPLDVIYASAPE